MIDIIGQPGRPATREEIEAYLKDCSGCFGTANNDCQKCQEPVRDPYKLEEEHERMV